MELPPRGTGACGGFFAYRPGGDIWPYAHEETREGACISAWVEHHQEVPPGWRIRESVFEDSTGSREISWHGHAADGLPLSSTVASDRDGCIARCWVAFGMTREALEMQEESHEENGRAVIKLRQAIPSSDSTSLPELLEEMHRNLATLQIRAEGAEARVAELELDR